MADFKDQLHFDFEGVSPLDNLALWTPRDIWLKLSQHVLEQFAEDRRIERKAGRDVDFADLATYLSTFSNTPDGGLLVFGVTDNGTITGCEWETTMQNRVETAHLKFCPMAKPEFKRVAVVVDGKQEYCLAAYCPYVGVLVETNKGEAYIRYGSSRHKMSEEEKQDFRATQRELSFEQMQAPYDFEDEFQNRIILDFCEEFRQRENKPDWTTREILLDRNLIREINRELVPTNALVLLAAKRPSKTIPGCRLRVQRFAGVEEGQGATYAPLKDTIIEGNVVTLIQEGRRIITEQIYDVTWLNNEGKFVTTPEYPVSAWFEALVNACVHRSYSFSGTEVTIKLFSDRMEIESPGGFVPPVNEQSIYYTRSSRNFHLMDALRYLGYVRMVREGTRRIRAEMQEYQLPDPEFKQETLHGVVVRVTLKNDHQSRKRATDKDVALYFGVEKWKRFDEHEVKIVAFTFRNGSIHVREAEQITGRTWATSKKDLERLVEKGALVFVPGLYQRDARSHYVLTPKAGGQLDNVMPGK